MPATVEVDSSLRITTIVTGKSLNVEDRIAIMDRVAEYGRETTQCNILLDVRELAVEELPGVKNLVVQLGLRQFGKFALVGDPPHHETLRRIVQWFPFGNELNVFSTRDHAWEWFAMLQRS